MKIYIIHEDNDGVIGVADSYESAVQFLIDKEWLTEDFEIWNREKDYSRPLYALEIKPEEIKTWNISKFNDFFNGDFEIEETNLITNARNKIEEVLTNDGLKL